MPSHILWLYSDLSPACTSLTPPSKHSPLAHTLTGLKTNPQQPHDDVASSFVWMAALYGWQRHTCLRGHTAVCILFINNSNTSHTLLWLIIISPRELHSPTNGCRDRNLHPEPCQGRSPQAPFTPLPAELLGAPASQQQKKRVRARPQREPILAGAPASAAQETCPLPLTATCSCFLYPGRRGRLPA